MSILSGWRALLGACAFIAGAAIGQAPGQATGQAPADRYVELRSGLFLSDWRSRAQSPMGDAQMDVVVVEIVRSLNPRPGWGPEHPAWAGVLSKVREDFGALVAKVNGDSRIGTLNERILNETARGLARSLDANEFEILIAFHGSPAGRGFNEVQRKMLALVGDALVDRLVRPMSSYRRAIDPARVDVIIGVVDDGFRWMAYAMGPRHAGGAGAYLTLLEAVTPVVRARIADMEALYLELTESERRGIEEFRGSPLGRRERDALLESGKTLHTIFDAEAEMKRLLEMLQVKVKDWSALVPN